MYMIVLQIVSFFSISKNHPLITLNDTKPTANLVKKEQTIRSCLVERRN